MYIARTHAHEGVVFSLRESYQDDTCYRSRKLVVLGDDPARHIHYLDNANFYIDDSIFSQLKGKGIEADPFELERIFFPFLDPLVQMRLSAFMDRSMHSKWKPLPKDERKRVNQLTHLFDKRRLHFLRFGSTDQCSLDRAAPVFQVLLDKSRDEIEQLIIDREQTLKPHEYKRYIFTVFDLQRFFQESYARTMPDALSEEKLDVYFIQEICAINRDENFWNGYKRTHPLPRYLQRYLFMYFDLATHQGLGWDAYMRAFQQSRARAVPPKGSRRMSMKEATTVFGISREKLYHMDKKEITKLYRKKAMDLHPDQGGDHEKFIELSSAYQEIIRTKR